ncbi:MAG: HAD-IB family phosphatase [Planctomycetota bacterium]
MTPLRDAPPPYATIVFDVDSTLSAIEGIDELAEAAGMRKEVSELTNRAMRGEIPLESVYKSRLDAIRPSREALEKLGKKYVKRVLPHARELVRALGKLDKRVCIVSGALEPAVRMLAEHLDIEKSGVFAVPVRHASDGTYAGFDESSPLARSGGKIAYVRRLAEASQGGLAIVGDGITDLEAAESASRFIAFGGVVKRGPVFERARVTCEKRDLAALLPLLVSPAEIRQLESASSLASLVKTARSLA